MSRSRGAKLGIKLKDGMTVAMPPINLVNAVRQGGSRMASVPLLAMPLAGSRLMHGSSNAVIMSPAFRSTNRDMRKTLRPRVRLSIAWGGNHSGRPRLTPRLRRESHQEVPRSSSRSTWAPENRLGARALFLDIAQRRSSRQGESEVWSCTRPTCAAVMNSGRSTGAS